MGDNIGKVIGILFMSRTYAHMAHLKTSSYAKHKALNKFYDDVVDLADDLAEAAQGKFGKLNIPYIELKGDISDPIAGINMHLVMIDNTVKKCDVPFIDNIVQEVQALYSKTLYLMKELD